jgi:head-tail adaptor
MPQIRRAIGDQRHLVTLEGVQHVPDGDGGTTETWVPLTPPTAWAMIEPGKRRDVEAVTGSAAIQAVATHVITLDYHPQLTVESRLWYNAREFQIRAIANSNEQNVQQILVCTEVLHGSDVGRVARAQNAAPIDAV